MDTIFRVNVMVPNITIVLRIITETQFSHFAIQFLWDVLEGICKKVVVKSN